MKTEIKEGSYQLLDGGIPTVDAEYFVKDKAKDGQHSGQAEQRFNDALTVVGEG